MAEPIDKDTALDVLIARVEDIREDIRDVRNDIKEANDSKVSHREWSQRNSEVNGRFSSMGREIGELRTEIRSKSAPWWSVAAVIVAIVSAAWTILNP